MSIIKRYAANIRLATQVITIYTSYLALLPVFFIALIIHRSPHGRPTAERLNNWIIYRFSNRLIAIFKVHINTLNTSSICHLPTKRPVLYMSNHFSMFDIPILYSVLPTSTRMLAKSEVFRMPLPFFGTIIKRLNFLSIHTCCKNHLRADTEKAVNVLKSGRTLWVSPEGDLSADGTLQPFKSGVFKIAMAANAIIVPVAISGSYDILAQGAWRTLRPKCHQRVTVVFGQPIDSDNYDKQRAKLRNETFNAITRLLADINRTEHLPISP